MEVKVRAKLGPGLILLDRDIGEMRFHILLRRWRKKKRRPESQPKPKAEPEPDSGLSKILVSKVEILIELELSLEILEQMGEEFYTHLNLLEQLPLENTTIQINGEQISMSEIIKEVKKIKEHSDKF